MNEYDINMAGLAEEEYGKRKILGTCAWCGNEILTCDVSYFEINGDMVCRDCIDDCEVLI